MKKLIVVAVLVIAGLALILPNAVMWEALQIQAGLGNTAPLTSASIKMLGGLICVALAMRLLNRKGS